MPIIAALGRAWTRYTELNVTRPILTKALTGGFLFSSGDLLAQQLDGTLAAKGYQPTRTLRAFCWNALIFTPVAHNWYCRALPRLFPMPAAATAVSAATTAATTAATSAATSKASALAAAAKKVAVDQLTFGPLVNAGFLTYSTALNNADKPAADIAAAVRGAFSARYWDLLRANWTLWPAVQLVNFTLVPPALQLLVMNATVVFWSTYLALQHAQPHAHAAKTAEAEAAAAPAE